MSSASGEPEAGAVPEPAAPSPQRPASPGGRYGLLLLLLIGTYLASAFTTGPVINAVQIIVFVLLLPLALRNSLVAPWIARLLIVVVLTGSAVAVGVSLSHPSATAAGVVEVWTALILLAVVVVIVRRVLASTTVTLQSIYGVLSAYMILGLMFAACYAAMGKLGGGPFFAAGQPGDTRTYQYFSFTTLTTLGYGDFTAARDAGRAVAVMEAMFGQIFLATLVARLVAAFRPSDARK